jgi:5-methylcytosine-specific restriction endonuclease McrA
VSVLLHYVTNKMRMSAGYQPLIIAALLRADGPLHRDDLVKELVLNDEDVLARGRAQLMRWPKATLVGRHGVVSYDRASKTFSIAEPVSPDERLQALAVCAALVVKWRKEQRRTAKAASRRFALVDAAGGRCQACGALGQTTSLVTSLNIDHVVPRSTAVNGKVLWPGAGWIDVDDPRNLQVLCVPCNRGKRDTSRTDFNPTTERLSEAIALILARCDDLGYDRAAVLAAAQAADRPGE